MGRALLGGMIQSGWARPEELAVIDLDATQRDAVAEEFPGVTVAGSALASVDTIIATKPHHVLVAAAALPTPKRVASVAAGITIASLEAVLATNTPVVRVMPNTPALVGVGASAVAPGTSASASDLDWALSFLSAVGTAVVVTEPQIDAVTGVSGSGPAYFFLIAEAMADAGVTAGLPRDIASKLVAQTMAGAAAMLNQSGDDPVSLRAAVTTPAGTTAAGLRALEIGGIRAALIEAVLAATERSRELGTVQSS